MEESGWECVTEILCMLPASPSLPSPFVFSLDGQGGGGSLASLSTTYATLFRRSQVTISDSFCEQSANLHPHFSTRKEGGRRGQKRNRFSSASLPLFNCNRPANALFSRPHWAGLFSCEFPRVFPHRPANPSALLACEHEGKKKLFQAISVEGKGGGGVKERRHGGGEDGPALIATSSNLESLYIFFRFRPFSAPYRTRALL